MSTKTSGVRMTGCIGRVNYVAWCMAVGRADPLKALAAWKLLPERERLAWRTAAETVLDEDWIERGGDSQKVQHHSV